MVLFDYPTGTPCWEYDTEKVKEALNNCDQTFPLGLVECDIEFENPE